MYGQGPLGFKTAQTVYRVSGHVHDASAYLVADRHFDGRTGKRDFKAAPQAIGGIHGHATHCVFSDMLLDFQNQLLSVRSGNSQGVMNGGKDPGLVRSGNVEVDVNDRTDYLRNESFGFSIWHRLI